MSFLFREKFHYYFHKQFSLWPYLDFPLFPRSFLFLLAEYLWKDFDFCRPVAMKNACAILIFLPKRKTNLNIFHITETRKRANNENISLVCVSISLSLHKYVGVCMYVMIFGKWKKWRTFRAEGRKTFPREIVVGKFASFSFWSGWRRKLERDNVCVSFLKHTHVHTCGHPLTHLHHNSPPKHTHIDNLIGNDCFSRFFVANF